MKKESTEELDTSQIHGDLLLRKGSERLAKQGNSIPYFERLPSFFYSKF
jgi:hypothetical protein